MTSGVQSPPAGLAIEAGARSGATALLRRQLATTPGRLRVYGFVIVVLAVVAGLLTAWVVSMRLDDIERIARNDEPVIEVSRRIQASIAEADAAASNAFLAGGVENAAQRQRYDESIAEAATGLEQAARLVGEDEDSHADIAVMVDALARYAGLVENARSNNRQGFPVGAAYLTAASALASDTIYPKSDDVANRASQRYLDTYNGLLSTSLIALGASFASILVLLAALLRTQKGLSRQFRRTLNRPMAAATVLVVGLLGWLTFASLAQASNLRQARAEGYTDTRSYIDVRATAFGAQAAESRFLISRGNDQSFEDEFVSRGERLMGELEDAEQRSNGLERSLAADAREAWTAYDAEHGVVLASLKEGDRSGAVNHALTTANEAFDRFDVVATEALSVNQREFALSMDDARSGFRGLQIGALLIAIAVAGLTIVGLQQRIDEYR